MAGHGGGGLGSVFADRYKQSAPSPPSYSEIQARIEEDRFDEFKRRHQINPDLEHLQLGASSWIGLELANWDKKNIKDRDIEYIAKACPKLKSLRFENLLNVTLIATSGLFSNSTMDFPGLIFFHVSKCPSLEDFKVCGPLLMRLEVVDNIALRRLQARVQFSAKIQVKSLSPLFKVEVEREPLEDSDLKLIQDPSVESLDLSYCEGVTDEGLKYLWKLPLKKLSLRGCKKLSDARISVFIEERSKTLKEIDLGDLPKLRLPSLHIATGFNSYPSLDLSDNPQLTDRDFDFSKTKEYFEKKMDSEMWVPTSPHWFSLSISNCPKLTSLVFSYFQLIREIRANHLPQLTDEGVKHLLPHILEKLSIAKCKRITDAALKTLEPFKKLQMLNIKGCPLVTARGVRSLQKAVTGIKILHDLESSSQ